LAQKDVTQATIVRKLASYERQNQTKKALWELEDVCRTLHILELIDDVQLRIISAGTVWVVDADWRKSRQ